jgi:protein TonB
MKTQYILTANILDILFDGRNKDYGAYDLRKNYNKRLVKSLSVTLCVCVMFTMGSMFAKSRRVAINAIPIIEVTLDKYKIADEPIIKKPKEQIKIQQQKPFEQTSVNIPVITPDKDVAPDEIVKSIDDLENVRIGASSVIGEKFCEDIIASPMNNSTIGNGNTKSVNLDDYEKIFVDVQIVAQFPGGLDAWKKYLERNLNAGLPAENGAQSGKYTVLISFVVDNLGNISDVKAENNPGFGTEAEAIRIIKKGPKWQPALQNGRKVAYKVKQQITFLVDEIG